MINENDHTVRTKSGTNWNNPGNTVAGALEIPDVVKDGETEYSVVAIGEWSFSANTDMKSVSIPMSVTLIEDCAFEACANLEKVEYVSVESLCAIDFISVNANPMCYAENAELYINGEQVNDLYIPETVTSIKDYTFSGCRKVTSVTISDSVTAIGNGAFDSCTGLTSINIPDYVTSIGDRAFFS